MKFKLGVGDEINYVFPEGWAADAEHVFMGVVIKVTDTEGIFVEPTKRAEGGIPIGACHHLNTTHTISREDWTTDVKIRDCILTEGEEEGKVDQLTKSRRRNMKKIIDESYEVLEKEVGNNPISALLQRPNLSRSDE